MFEWQLMNNELWTRAVTLRASCILIIEWTVNYLIICISLLKSEKPSARRGGWPWQGEGGDGSYWGCLGNLQLMDWGKSSKLHQMRYVQTWPTSCHEHSAGVASAHRSRVPRRWMPGCCSGVWDVVICRDLWAHGFSVHVAQAWLHCEFVTVSLLGFDSSFSVNLCT